MELMPREEFRKRIAQHYRTIAKVTLNTGAQDGGPRSSFRMIDSTGRCITEWEDWALHPEEANAELRRYWHDVRWSDGGASHTFTLRGFARVPGAPPDAR